MCLGARGDEETKIDSTNVQHTFAVITTHPNGTAPA